MPDALAAGMQQAQKTKEVGKRNGSLAFGKNLRGRTGTAGVAGTGGEWWAGTHSVCCWV